MSQYNIKNSGSPSGSGILTINGISPDSGGNFTLESTDASITLSPITNGINEEVAAPLQTFVYVDPQTGSDSTGTGTGIRPFATLTHANGFITDNSISKRYTIILMGTAIETAVTFKPYVNIFGCSPNASRIQVTGGSQVITLDATWVNLSSITISNIIFLSTGLDLDDSATTGSLGNEITLINCEVGGATTFSGKTVNNEDFFICIDCLLDNNVTVTNASFETIGCGISGTIDLSATSGNGDILWASQNDSTGGAIIISETMGDVVTCAFIGDNLLGTFSLSGANCNATFDAISNPQSGITLLNSATMSSYIPAQTGTINQISRIANSASINQTITSGLAAFPYAVGAFNEVVFNTLCTDITSSTVAPGWTTSSDIAAASSLLTPYANVFQNTPANGNALIFTSPINLDVGSYVILYQLFLTEGSPLMDLSVTLAGGTPFLIRSQFDMYQNFGPGQYMSMVDQFTNSTANASLVLAWTPNGKNASSSGYITAVSDCLRIIKIG